jgi:hypothetical protein
MNEIIAKISSYEIFNNLLPGIIFVVLTEEFTNYSIPQDNLFVAVFLYYFIGLVIGRVGSLIVEPFLKFVKFLIFEKYEIYVEATKKDSKIEILNEKNNMYRSFISTLLLFIFVKWYEGIDIPQLESWNQCILLIALLLLFLISYKKQTSYIKKRISLTKK